MQHLTPAQQVKAAASWLVGDFVFHMPVIVVICDISVKLLPEKKTKGSP